MICIKNNKLFGCADLTVSTCVLGAVMTLVAIVNLVGGEGSDRFLSIYTLLFGLACCSVMFLRENILLRKILIGLLIGNATIMVARIVWFTCIQIQYKDSIDAMGSLAEASNTTIIVIASIVFAIDAILMLLFACVLIGGLQEQVAIQAKESE